MNLEDYIELSGVTVLPNREGMVTAAIGRTQNILEDLLGYTLDPELVMKNLYTETGKATLGWFYPSVDVPDILLPPDPVVGAYRLYSFNSKDQIFHVDPYSALNALKIVRGNVTVHTFNPIHYGAHRARYGVQKYIDMIPTWFDLILNELPEMWLTELQLAVDANWVWTPDEIRPADLNYVWSDMITYYADPKREVQLENTGGHSYRKFDVTANRPSHVPQELPENINVLNRYAGPFGSATRTLVV